MTIDFACDCGRGIAVPDREAGQRRLCPGCFDLVRVPIPPGVELASVQPEPEPVRRASGASLSAGGLLLMASGLPLSARAASLELATGGLLMMLLLCLAGVFMAGRG